MRARAAGIWGVAGFLVAAGFAWMGMAWWEAVRWTSPPEKPRPFASFEFVPDRDGDRPSEREGYTIQAASFGYASSYDDEHGDYLLSSVAFDPVTGKETMANEGFVGRDWPRRRMPVAVGSPAVLDLVLGVPPDGIEPERYDLFDQRTGVWLDGETSGVRVSERQVRVTFYPKVLHSVDVVVRLQMEEGREVQLELARWPGIPEANVNLDDLFDLRIPCLVADRYDLSRILADLCQVRLGADLAYQPRRLGPVVLADVTPRECFRDILGREEERVGFDRADLEFERVTGWRERVERWLP